MTTLQGFSREYLASLFSYDRETGLVTRRVASNRWEEGRWKEGQVAGSTQDRYVVVNVGGVMVLAHRLAWFLETGNVPPRIDHRNRDKKDNSWTNLREATAQQNAANSPRREHNASGFKGVHLCKATGRYRAQLKFDGRNIHLGRYDTPEQAAAAYDAKAVELHAGFAGTND